MPPVTKAGGDTFRKDIEFVLKDDDEDEQIAAGIVMVPDKADLQHDFAREETIRSFASQFEAFVEAGEAGGGVMHAVWPDDWMDLERNEVLDEAEEIGGETVDAGAWIQEWRINHDDLWELILEGVLGGYSIGAIQVDWGGPYEQDEDAVAGVDIPDDLDEGALIWELTEGLIREVSAVDIPAVPDAQILDTKAMEKRLGDHLGDPNGFLEEAQERGHSEDDAEWLWDVMMEAREAEGSDEPGKESRLSRAAKAFIGALTPGQGSDDDGTDTKTSEALDAATTDKEGRTLSTSNRHSLYATIDASLDILQDAGVDHGMTRFTDRDDTTFDLTEHSARTWSNPPDEDEDDEEEEDDKHAAGGDTPDTDGSTEAAAMPENNDDPMADAPEWAKALHDDIEKNSERIDEALGGEGQKSDPMEDAPEWAKALKENTEKNAERIDAISKQTGATESQQLGGAEKGGETEEGLSKRQEFFIPASKKRQARARAGGSR